MVVRGLTIDSQDGAFVVKGSLDEFADLDPLINEPAPLILELSGIVRMNSMGIRNFLKFLNAWGEKELIYRGATADFIDQLNMIPSLAGVASQAKVESAFIPLECTSCGHEEDVKMALTAFEQAVKDNGELPPAKCSQCGGPAEVLNDAFFVFLDR